MVLVHPLSDQPASSPITTPAATPHTPALVQRYIDYLKDRYINKSPILKEKLLLQPKEFIRLNLVSNTDQEDIEFKSDCLLLKAVRRCCCNKEEEETNGDGGHW